MSWYFILKIPSPTTTYNVVNTLWQGYPTQGEYKKYSNSVDAFTPDGKSLGVVFEITTPFDTIVLSGGLMSDDAVLIQATRCIVLGWEYLFGCKRKTVKALNKCRLDKRSAIRHWSINISTNAGWGRLVPSGVIVSSDVCGLSVALCWMTLRLSNRRVARL